MTDEMDDGRWTMDDGRDDGQLSLLAFIALQHNRIHQHLKPLPPLLPPVVYVYLPDSGIMSSSIITRRSNLLLICMVLATTILLQACDAFAPTKAPLSRPILRQSSPSSKLMMSPSPLLSAVVEPYTFSSTIQLSAATTLDPTTVLSDLLGGLLGGPAILLVPIVAALGLASLIAWLIVSYASPVVEDDE